MCMSTWLYTLVDMYEYLAIDIGGYVNQQSSCSNCSKAKLGGRWNEQVCQGVKCKALGVVLQTG